MEQGGERGMMTFDQSLYDLYTEGAISLEEALNHADSRNNLALRIRLNGNSGAKPQHNPRPAKAAASETPRDPEMMITG